MLPARFASVKENEPTGKTHIEYFRKKTEVPTVQITPMKNIARDFVRVTRDGVTVTTSQHIQTQPTYSKVPRYFTERTTCPGLQSDPVHSMLDGVSNKEVAYGMKLEAFRIKLTQQNAQTIELKMVGWQLLT